MRSSQVPVRRRLDPNEAVKSYPIRQQSHTGKDLVLITGARSKAGMEGDRASVANQRLLLPRPPPTVRKERTRKP